MVSTEGDYERRPGPGGRQILGRNGRRWNAGRNQLATGLSLDVFAGRVSFRGAAPQQHIDRVLAGTRWRGSKVKTQASPSALFVQSGLADRQPPGGLFASVSRLDDRKRIAAAHGIAAVSDADCIRAMLEAFGDRGVSALLGAFAFAHWDEQTGTLTLARDYIGQKTLFYYVGDGLAVFASDLATLLAVPEVPRALDERRLAHFMAENHHEGEDTFYQGIRRVLPGAIIRLTRDGISSRRYWAPRFDPPAVYASPEDYVRRARELFDRAMRRTVGGASRIAITLSGGLDSSAIAATAARLGVPSVDTYTGVPPAGETFVEHPGKYLDERSKVEALGRRYPALGIKFVAPTGAHWKQADPARAFASVPIPTRGVAAMGWFAQINDAILKDGHDILLHGGFGNHTVTPDGDHVMATLLASGRLRSLMREARETATRTGRGLVRTLALDAGLPLLSPRLFRLALRLRGGKPWDIARFSLLRQEIVDELDLRGDWRAQGYDPVRRYTELGARGRAHQLFDMLHSTREWAALSYEADGLDLRSPFNDRELVEFCLQVPETLHNRHGVRRWFGRQVFADRLPDEILWETRRGEQMMTWFDSLNARREQLAAETGRLGSSALGRRLIDLPRLEQLIRDWPKNQEDAEEHRAEYRLALDRALHVAQFVRWVGGGNG